MNIQLCLLMGLCLVNYILPLNIYQPRQMFITSDQHFMAVEFLFIWRGYMSFVPVSTEGYLYPRALPLQLVNPIFMILAFEGSGLIA